VLTAAEALRRPVAATHEITRPTVEMPRAQRPVPLAIEVTRGEGSAAGKALVCPDTRSAGLYKLQWQDAQSGPGHDLYAVSADTRESELARIERDELRKLWGALEPEVIAAATDADKTLSVQGQEIWRTLAIGLFGLLLAESCLATWAGRTR
jgi:hypothetical protein